MVLREQDKHFLWSLYAVVSIIFVWKGLWEGVYALPYICEYRNSAICDPFVFLFIGFTMLTLSGAIFKEFDPLGGVEAAVNKIIHFVQNHPRKAEFDITYHDKNQKKDITVNAEFLKGMEKGVIVIEDQVKKQEFFIPIHRIKEILQNGKVYWRL
ncbi:MAG: hypothetical protein Q7K45_05260 [Nanoarchaeota archaeon]|nr:hypothetical protein [Nanoarchaeota archaeon]